jgi:glycerol uptake facilitator protein
MHALLPIKREKAGADLGYAWIPVLAPITGGALAAILFMVLK